MIIKVVLIGYVIMIFKRSVTAKAPYKRFIGDEDEGYEYNNIDDWHKDILRDSYKDNCECSCSRCFENDCCSYNKCPDCTIPTALIYFHTPTPLFYLHTPALIFISKLANPGQTTQHTTHSNAAHTKTDESVESNTEAPNSNESTNGPSNERTTEGEDPTNEESKSSEEHSSVKHTQVPTTEEPTTEEPTTEEPTTEESTTEKPTTKEPTTEEPTTVEPTTEEPTTEEPTTEKPTTEEPTTEEPTTQTRTIHTWRHETTTQTNSIRTWPYQTTTTTLDPYRPNKLTEQTPCDGLPSCLIKQKTVYDIHKYFQRWRISDSFEVTLTPKLQSTEPWNLKNTQNTPIPNLPRFGIVAIPPAIAKQMVTKLDYDEVANHLNKLNWITIF